LFFNGLPLVSKLLSCEAHGSQKKTMLKIRRSANEKIVFTLSGRIEVEDVAELQRLLDLELADRTLALDLKDVTLVDRGAVKFLTQCEVDSIELENCPLYIREWIQRERGRNSRRRRQ
jgi:ABC-type transporter Mla MlaB component